MSLHQNSGTSLPPARKSVPHHALDKRGLAQISQPTRVETIAPDECVLIHLHQAPHGPDIDWAGIVLSADATAIRLEVVWSACNGMRVLEEGRRCVPWHRIDTVEIVALAETETAAQR